ncbi:lipoate--protein ligase [Lawsonibacter hominis]|uniref:lipoate--protein ligase n=1 Tax=Lawsonibacter hominis TaxID=2763053 RepID=A0A8J6MEE3_9FIRM|nr:lipoate--protein ligase [Lawsonibacter hominis]MBC5732768.1 lipoate--protein ligase [Lawsonibacter hominis]
MYYLESTKTDPSWNLALEQYVFDVLGPRDDCFMLWQNDNTIVVGKHQNTLEEINTDYVKEHGVTVVRRLSGGGAVYHDLGNLNFTFVAENRFGSEFDFSTFCRPVMDALRSLGVPAEINGRNDMTIEGRKFSGNAQYMKKGRIMHHGTLMYDSDLEAVSRALNVKPDKIESKGLKSVRSRVTNIRPYVTDQTLTVDGFREILRRSMFRAYPLTAYALTPEDLDTVERLRRDVYRRWEWNYGASPACRIRKERRVEGCGVIQVHMEVEHGCIAALAFFGDYFSLEDSGTLVQRLLGVALEEGALRAALDGCAIGRYFSRLDLDTFLSILLQ